MRMHDVSCAHCGKAFQAKNTTAKWCTTSCRVSGNRAAKAGRQTPAQKAGMRPGNVLTLHQGGAARSTPPSTPATTPTATRTDAALAATDEAREAGGPVTRATRATLDAAQRTETPDGQVAITLAARIDRSMDESGAAAASLAGAHAKALDRAMVKVATAGDVVDDMQKLRDQIFAAVEASTAVPAPVLETTAPPVEATG